MLKTPAFRTAFKLEYPLAVTKFGKPALRQTCYNKEQTVNKERKDFLRALFCKQSSRSGRTTKFSEKEGQSSKLGPLTQDIESQRLTIAQERIGEAFERLTILQKRLDADVEKRA
jgi:hypothetical protein